MAELCQHGDLPQSGQGKSQTDGVQAKHRLAEESEHDQGSGHENEKDRKHDECALAQSLALGFGADGLVGGRDGGLQGDITYPKIKITATMPQLARKGRRISA